MPNEPEAIDEDFNEILFKLWMNGKQLVDIHNMFRGSPRKFSYNALCRAKKRYDWDNRRSQILSELRSELDNEIKVSRRKQLQLVQMSIDMNLRIIESEYVDFMRDPKAYIESYRLSHRDLPPWLSLDSKSMLDLLKAHHFATAAEVKDSDGMGRGPQLVLTPEEETMIWQTIRAAATRRVLPAPTNTKDIIVETKNDQ